MRAATTAKVEAILHPAWTYTARELAGAAWGTVVFAAAAVAPGFCIAHLLAPVQFRSRHFREQLAWSVALSFGPGVLLIVAAVAVGGAAGGAAFVAASAAGCALLFRRYPARSDVTRRQLLLALAAFALWMFVVLGSLVDIGVSGRLWMSVTAYDHGLRTAFVDAVLRTGLPPVDPVYWPGRDVPMRYYYFWYAVCAAVAKLAHIGGREALIAGCVWPLPGVAAMLGLFGRYVLKRRGRELTRLTVTASALLGVTGLDLLVTVALHLLHTPVLADMEWWSIDQVASWPDTFLWVPHHAAALVAAALGLLLLLLSVKASGLHSRLGMAAVAGLSLAAAFGMSAYVAVGAAFLVACWMLVEIHATGGRTLQVAATAGLVSATVLSRFLWQLAHGGGSGTRSGSPLYIGVREILSPDVLAASPVFHGLALHHPLRAREFAAALLLLPGWAVELGFFEIVLLVACFRWRRSTRGERMLLGLTLAGLAGSSFFRSGVIATNDYGIRSALLPQFFLLLTGAIVLQSSTGGFRRFLQLLVVVGGSGCVYQMLLLRTYLPVQDAEDTPAAREVGERTYALREAYASLQEETPLAARIQFDPASTSFSLYPHLLYANRQVITAEFTCSTSFGGDPAACPAIQNALLQLFPQNRAAVPHAMQARQLCRALGAQYLVATRWDTVWASPSGWTWELPVVVAQPAVRVLQCGP